MDNMNAPFVNNMSDKEIDDLMNTIKSDNVAAYGIKTDYGELILIKKHISAILIGKENKNE